MKTTSWQRFLANAGAVLDATCSTLYQAGVGSLCAKPLLRRVEQSKPASPYASYRLLKDPPGRYKTEYGELLLMPYAPSPVLVEYAIEEHVTPINQTTPLTPQDIKRLKVGDPGVRVHWDLRWRDPETKEVHAVVLPKARLPVKGERHQVIKADDRHGHTELINTGLKDRNRVIITEGYGRGHSRVISSGKTFVWSGKDNSFHMWVPGEGPYAIILPDQWRQGTPRNYLMFPLVERDVPHHARPYKVIDLSDKPEELEALLKDRGWIAERKYDGAFYTIEVNRRSGHDYANVQVISRRPKHIAGEPTDQGIDRSMSLPHIKFANWPEWAYGKRIYIEVYSKSQGHHASPHGRSTALLNMDPAKSFEEQQRNGLLRVKILGIEDPKQHLDYSEQRRLATRLHEEVTYTDAHGHKVYPLRVPSSAQTTLAKGRFLQTMRTKGEEGIVLKNLQGPPQLAKHVFRGRTQDMRIIGVEPMATTQPKYLDADGQVVAAQRFKVIDEAGKIRYVVIRDPEGGPGSTDTMRLDAGHNPGKYLGTYVEVRLRRGNREQAGDIQRIRFDK